MLSASRLCPSTPLGPLAPDPRYWVALSRSACAPQVDFAPISFSLAPVLVYIAVGSDPLTFWATICKTVRPMLSARCLSVLSVMLVYCGQTVGWIKIKLGMEAGLGLGHIVLDGDTAPVKGAQLPQFLAHIYCGQTAGCIRIPLGIRR